MTPSSLIRALALPAALLSTLATYDTAHAESVRLPELRFSIKTADGIGLANQHLTRYIVSERISWVHPDFPLPWKPHLTRFQAYSKMEGFTDGNGSLKLPQKTVHLGIHRPFHGLGIFSNGFVETRCPGQHFPLEPYTLERVGCILDSDDKANLPAELDCRTKFTWAEIEAGIKDIEDRCTAPLRESVNR